MQRNPLVVVFDIESAIEGITAATADRTFAEFQADWLLRHGVQRGIEIISEAARRLPHDLLDQYPEIPWPRIRAVGNVLRHEYQSISDEIVWNVVKTEIPRLQNIMRDIRTRLEAENN